VHTRAPALADTRAFRLNLARRYGRHGEPVTRAGEAGPPRSNLFRPQRLPTNSARAAVRALCPARPSGRWGRGSAAPSVHPKDEEA
jgi:hypothetical protein